MLKQKPTERERMESAQLAACRKVQSSKRDCDWHMKSCSLTVSNTSRKTRCIVEQQLLFHWRSSYKISIPGTVPPYCLHP